MRAVVTGRAGFIGSHIVDALLDRDPDTSADVIYGGRGAVFEVLR